jgi:hypothetical protein|tara:strand:+ start:351 stop:506 length:156 start_codon:yes stop_codon:yes gene_type:complete
MIDEITYLRRMIYTYKNPGNDKDFTKAEKHLNKVHRQYGTIDVSAIQNLIK